MKIDSYVKDAHSNVPPKPPSQLDETKLQRAVMAIYAVVVIELGVGLYTFLSILKLQAEYASLDYGDGTAINLTFLSLLWPAMIAICGLYIIKPLRERKLGAWIAALCIFVFCAPGFSLPASIIGLLSLLDRDVRTHFLNELDVKL